jgi:SAM-dependent methyltransferase
MERSTVAGSFRDPDGFLFRRGDTLYRQVNTSYQEDYDQLMGSGLYDALTSDGLLVSHTEVDVEPAAPGSYQILRPEPLSFISYPYEWCFSQLQDAALLTLRIQKKAMEAGLSLKDASAYNVQFRDGDPIFIDTLSFERYQEGRPWVAYAQFCQHFLAPLALMSYTDVRLSKLLRAYLDGVPLDLASTLLPTRTYLKFSLLTHIHLHSRGQERYADTSSSEDLPDRHVGRNELLGIIDSLESAVKKLRWTPEGTEWSDYYQDVSYSDDAFDAKERFVSDVLESAQPESVWDLGANTGRFSRIAANAGIDTMAFDVDPAAVEQAYRSNHGGDADTIYPLVLDLTNPSPGIGWAHRERKSFRERGPADMILALALVHHLAISNNVPLPRLARFLSQLCQTLVIEFIPKHDEQVQRLLVSREDIFSTYSQDHFEEAFSEFFAIDRVQKVPDAERRLYYMEKI